MKKLFLLLVTVLSVSLCALAQNRTVMGTVVDDADGEPIAGASVVPVGAKKGVITDADGNFSISVPSSVKALTVSYIGYTSQNVVISGSRLNVRLKTSIETKDEVIVVAYGTAKRSAYTGSAGVVKADQLEDSQTGNVVNALNGRVAGVQLQSTYGAPGSVAKVRIRGVGSINANDDPLYVLDGIPLNSSDDLAAVPNSDIAEITVLKDAASTALYGARGANGVVLVTTKSAGEGDAKVTLDMKWGSNSRSLARYNTINDPRQYIETLYQAHYYTALDFYGATYKTPEQAHAYANSQIWPSLGYQTWTIPAGQDIVGTNGKFNPNATPGYVDGNYYYIADDWYKETLSHGFRQEYNLSISGGTQKLKYYVSGSYLDDGGIVKESYFKRFSSRATVDYQAKSWLKIGTTMSYAYQNSNSNSDNNNTDGDNGTSTGNAFNIALHLGPVFPVYVRDPKGVIRYSDAYGKPIYDYGDGKDYGWGHTSIRNTYSMSNPIADMIYDRNEILADVFNGKWYAQITPITGLNIIGNAGYFVDNTRLHYVKNMLFGSGADYKGQAIQEQIRNRTINLQGMVTYSHQFGDHGMDLMFTAENTAFNQEYVEASGQNLYDPTSPFVNGTIDQRRGYGASYSVVRRGFLGRANYNYAGRYFASVSVRRDGSSRFHKDHRWGTFWSASAAWDISKEKFMQDFENVDMLKFKFSFGQTGNDGIGFNGIAWADQYTITGADGVWSDGTIAYKGNKEITWETSNSLNTGFDFSFFKGRLSGSLEYYQRETKDMLFRVPTAPSLGYRTIPMNNGSMRNNGFELDLNVRAVNTKDVTLDVFANVTLGWNKVLKLNKDILNTNENWNKNSKMGWLNGSQFYLEGQSAFQLFIPEYAGVNNDPELKNPDGSAIPLGNPLYWTLTDKLGEDGEPIKYTYYDKDGNQQTANVQEEVLTDNVSDANTKNRKLTGNLLPKAYGGFGVDLYAYGIHFKTSCAYQLGGRIMDYSYQDYMSPFTTAQIGQAFHKDLLNAWTPNNTNTDVPRLAAESTVGVFNATSTRWLTSSNYLSLNNIYLGYVLPAKWTTRIALNEVEVYFNADNVALWSRRKGLDPRQNYLNSDNSTYSPIRTISGGIRVNF